MQNELFWYLTDRNITQIAPNSRRMTELGDRAWFKDRLHEMKTDIESFNTTFQERINAQNFRASSGAILELIKSWYRYEKMARENASKLICKKTVISELGITATLQERFKINPDKRVRNPHYRRASEMCLYNRFKLEMKISTNPELKAEVEKVLARREKQNNPSEADIAKREKAAARRRVKKEQEREQAEREALAARLVQVRLTQIRSEVTNKLTELADSSEYRNLGLDDLNIDEVSEKYFQQVDGYQPAIAAQSILHSIRQIFSKEDLLRSEMSAAAHSLSQEYDEVSAIDFDAFINHHIEARFQEVTRELKTEVLGKLLENLDIKYAVFKVTNKACDPKKNKCDFKFVGYFLRRIDSEWFEYLNENGMPTKGKLKYVELRDLSSKQKEKVGSLLR